MLFAAARARVWVGKVLTPRAHHLVRGRIMRRTAATAAATAARTMKRRTMEEEVVRNKCNKIDWPIRSRETEKIRTILRQREEEIIIVIVAGGLKRTNTRRKNREKEEEEEEEEEEEDGIVIIIINNLVCFPENWINS
jgi:hypothetical protein